jgi:Ca2+-binding EF-hand superfamily protein
MVPGTKAEPPEATTRASGTNATEERREELTEDFGEAHFEVVFKDTDRDGNGFITAEELKRHLSEAEALADEACQVKVRGGNGFILAAEAAAKYEAHAVGVEKFVVEKVTDVEGFVESFKVEDNDGNGFITADELRDFFAKAGEYFTGEQGVTGIGFADVNGDGQVSLEE